MNMDSCGLRYKPTIHKLYFNNKCFKNSYPNKTLYDSVGYLFDAREEYLNTRIHNGELALNGEAPWSVYLSKQLLPHGWGEHAIIGDIELGYCGGSLVTFEWVLTAAHCISSWLDIYAYVGSVERRKEYNPHRKASNWIIHPHYEVNGQTFSEYDLALVKINKKFVQDFYSKGSPKAVNTICLPKQSNKDSTEYEKAFLFGFGLDNSQPPDYLQKMELTISPVSWFCFKYQMLCTYVTERHQKACPGDSGSGLVQFIGERQAKALLIGVFIGFYPANVDCIDAQHNLFVPVYKHMDWIVDTIYNN